MGKKKEAEPKPEVDPVIDFLGWCFEEAEKEGCIPYEDEDGE